MRKIYLCGHTGSVNRGCEAILRSTTGLLRQAGQQEVGIMTMDPDYDRRLGLDRIATLIPYGPKPLPVRILCALRRKLLHDGVWGARYIHKPLEKVLKSGDILFNVGGDTYCYGTPNVSYAMNQLAADKGLPTVFWGCSVDERVLTDRRMQQDINRYSYIVVRESISRDYLLRVVRDPNRVLMACDPAFWLEPLETELPAGFAKGNTVGINISPLVIRDCGNEEDIMCRNVYALIDGILSQTDMPVCLIPHVYDPDTGVEDSRILGWLYRRYADEPRVMLVDQCLSCRQLKYIVSNCRFFVGARTHTVIAAYSSGVPALAISYSVKSLGIAKDLLGSAEDYAIQWKKIEEPDVLWNRFRTLMDREQEILTRYQQELPAYKTTVQTAVDTVLRSVP